MPPSFRVAALNSHPIQYFAPLYAYLNRDKKLDITALYLSDASLRGAVDEGFGRAVTWDVDLLSGYRHVFLGDSLQPRHIGHRSSVCTQVWSEIRSGKYDAVWLHGYGHTADIVAFVAAKSKGLPVFMRSETHLALHRARWRRWIRDAVLSFAYRFVDGFLAIGSANRFYYRSLGIPDRKIFDVPYSVDNERFIAAATLRPEERNRVRHKYGLPLDKTIVLYVSKLTPRKRPEDLVQAMAALRDRGSDATLFIVGTGEMEPRLRELARSSALGNVVFGGFINQSELPRVYAAADIFVLPSENEPWGLIVNEVMCAGIPVIVSAEVGCVPDLVADGVNGYHTKARDVASLVAAVERLLDDKQRRQQMGIAGLAIVRRWSYEQCRAGLVAAIEQCVVRK